MILVQNRLLPIFPETKLNTTVQCPGWSTSQLFFSARMANVESPLYVPI